jgi:hypothetical protein
MTDLLKKRWMVIAPYPHSEFKVNEILDRDWSWDGNDKDGFKDCISNYPHLFDELKWWQQRNANEMPEYLRYIGNNMRPPHIHQVKEHFHRSEAHPHYVVGIFLTYDNSRFFYDLFIPATEEEYLKQETK